jgi:hypothetical protein
VEHGHSSSSLYNLSCSFTVAGAFVNRLNDIKLGKPQHDIDKPELGVELA